MIEEISRVVKKIYTYKDLCNLLHVASEYRGFNIVDIAGIIAETNKVFYIENTSELSRRKYKDYAYVFLYKLYGAYFDKFKEFLSRR